MTVHQTRDQLKSSVAVNSVLAALALTFGKLAVGLLTGSLRILAEAAHSALNLLAAGLTLFAVRFSSRPPDSSHPYGHGKVENLSAFLEAGLLLVTCGWIVYEAFERLFLNSVHVEPSIWAFVVMFASIAIDYSRSRSLRRVAEETGSQALMADALHFSTDIWGSVSVIAGLTLVLIDGAFGGTGWLASADVFAALAVAGLTVYVSLNLLRETTDALLDRAPEDVARKVELAIDAMAGVLKVSRVRVRRGGSVTFVDLVVSTDRLADFETTHELTERIESAVHALVNGETDIVVHIEPEASPDETIAAMVRHEAVRHGGRAHDVYVRELATGLEVDFHFEVPGELSLREASTTARKLEARLLQSNESVRGVNIHLEAPPENTITQKEVTAEQGELVRRIKNIADEASADGATQNVRLFAAREGGGFDAMFNLTLPGDLNVEEAHERTERVELALRRSLSSLRSVLIRAIPQDHP